jgi:hypothetical protein
MRLNTYVSMDYARYDKEQPIFKSTCGAGTNYPSRSHDFLSDVVCDARSLVFFVVLLYIIVQLQLGNLCQWITNTRYCRPPWRSALELIQPYMTSVVSG